MANERTWYAKPNLDVAGTGSATVQIRATLWSIKEALTGALGAQTHGLWTVEGSCDGVTAGMDGVDRWGSTFDSSKFVFSANSTLAARSWIVLRSPDRGGLRVSLLINYQSNTATEGPFEVYWTFGTYALNATPTRKPGASAFEITALTAAQILAAEATPHRLHVARTDAGDVVLLISKNGSGRFCTAWLLTGFSELQPGDPFDFASFLEYAPTASVLSNLPSGSHSLGQSITTTTLPGLRTRNAGGPVNAAGVFPCFTSGGGAASGLFGSSGIPNADTFSGLINDFPVYVLAAGSLKGRLPDIRWCPSGTADGTFSTVANDGSTVGEVQSISAGDCWVPWSGTTLPVL